MVDIPNDPAFTAALRASANRLGISPVDLATAISYETRGTFHPWEKGPTTKWGQHRGLIQFGEPQRQKYGVHEKQTAADQVPAVEAYLRDHGVKPGMGLLDVYSAINAGGVGRYGASDEAAGGAPGSVADKVRTMAAHRVRAAALLGEPIIPVAGAPAAAAAVSPAGAAAGAPLGFAPQAGDDAAFQNAIAMLQRATSRDEDEGLPSPLPPLRIGRMPLRTGFDRRRYGRM